MPDQKQDKLTSKPDGDPPGNKVVQAENLFWRRFAEATTPKEFCQGWLPLQALRLKGVRCAMILLGEPGKGPYTPVAVWPDANLRMHHLAGTAERSLQERRGVLVDTRSMATADTKFPERFQLGYPIEVEGQIHGTIVLGVDAVARNAVQETMRQLHWGAAWLEVLIRRTQAQEASHESERLQTIFDLIVSAVEFESFHASAMSLVTRMTTALGCDRVSVGFTSGRRIQVKVMSHTAEFDKQTNLVRAIGAAMDEAVDQAATVAYPLSAESDPLVCRAHEELSQRHGSGAVCTVPLGDQGRFFGGVTLERPADKPFDRKDVELCEAVAAMTGPTLYSKRREERWLFQKAFASLARQLKRLFGPSYWIRKLVAVLLTAVVLFFAFYETDYRLSGITTIEGAVQRVVPAPFNGYIRKAPIRPGDVVKAGQVLCFLDDRDLKLERVKWSTQKEQQAKEYQAAMAEHDRAKIRILRARINQADAQIALIDEQLVRAKIVAPFDGVVMSGDLSQLLGAPTERGQVLFEMAPLDAYRVIVQVDERDINNVAVGQVSVLLLPSMSGESFPFEITKITPVSTAKEGRNYFRVEGSLTESSDRLRPGMEGIGKITVDRRKLIWIWTHEMGDWCRLQFWRWMP